MKCLSHLLPLSWIPDPRWAYCVALQGWAVARETFKGSRRWVSSAKPNSSTQWLLPLCFCVTHRGQSLDGSPGEQGSQPPPGGPYLAATQPMRPQLGVLRSCLWLAPIILYFVNDLHNRLPVPWGRKRFVYSMWSSTSLTLSEHCIHNWHINWSQRHHVITTILPYPLPYLHLLFLLQRVYDLKQITYLLCVLISPSAKQEYTYFHQMLFLKLGKMMWSENDH